MKVCTLCDDLCTLQAVYALLVAADDHGLHATDLIMFLVGLLAAFASVCPAVTQQLFQWKQQGPMQLEAAHLGHVQQQQQQQDPHPALSEGMHVIVHSLLHVWDLLQPWWPGKKLAYARGLAVIVQPFAGLLVAIIQRGSSFRKIKIPTAATTSSGTTTSSAAGSECHLNWFLGDPASHPQGSCTCGRPAGHHFRGVRAPPCLSYTRARAAAELHSVPAADSSTPRARNTAAVYPAADPQ